MEKETQVTELNATIISTSKDSVVLLMGSSYIHIRQSELDMDIIVNGKVHTFPYSSGSKKAITSIIEAISNAEPYESVSMNEYWPDDDYDDRCCEWGGSGGCDNSC